MARFSSLSLAGLLLIASTVQAAQAGSIVDIEHLGSGGMCNASTTTDGLVKVGNNMAIGRAQSTKNCDNLITNIVNVRRDEIRSQENINNRLLNTNMTVGLVNGLAPLATTLLGGLLSGANRQPAPQPAAQPAADNSQYLQVIQQQQKQIDELRQLMLQRAATPQPQPAYTSMQDDFRPAQAQRQSALF